jgi:hypothetical protein
MGEREEKKREFEIERRMRVQRKIKEKRER